MEQICRRDILLPAVAWAAFLVLTFVSVSTAGTQTGEDPAKVAAEDASGSGMRINVREGLLSVELGDGVPLGEVLRAIASQAGFRLTTRGDLGDAQAQAFTNVPMEKGIARLVGNHSLLMIHDPSGNHKSVVRVYEASHLKQGAREPSPPPLPPEFWMWSRKLREHSRKELPMITRSSTFVH